MSDLSMTKLEKLKAKERELKALIRQEEERKRRDIHKQDTRRKVLAGAAIMAEAEKRPEFRQELMGMLGRFLIRDDERALFDLPPRVSVVPKLAIVTPEKLEAVTEENEKSQSA